MTKILLAVLIFVPILIARCVTDAALAMKKAAGEEFRGLFRMMSR